ncbi:dehydrase and lipid transport-domain-containing protein [Spinellus fusiger]|nr:dehydrase and lipid transport-domain-containing protein [Spinellus fusiger]
MANCFILRHRLAAIPLPLQQNSRRNFFTLPNLLSSRKEYSERQLLNFSPKQIYTIVSNVKDYHMFVPFCTVSRVYSSQPLEKDPSTHIMKAELGVGFHPFQEKYMSHVTCKEPSLVKAVSADTTLFKELVTTWKFTPYTRPSLANTPQTRESLQCYVDFNIVFEFASPLHAQASSVFFDKVSKMMLGAFVSQCEAVYGKKNV